MYLELTLGTVFGIVVYSVYIQQAKKDQKVSRAYGQVRAAALLVAVATVLVFYTVGNESSAVHSLLSAI